MTNSLGDVLSNRNYAEPPEVKQIKAFVLKNIGVSPSVSITTEAYVIKTGSAAAAGALRSKIYLLQQELGDNKRVVIRIS